MNQSAQNYFNYEQNEMQGIDIQTLVQVRLSDMADQIAYLIENGHYDLAKLLHTEGMQLAKFADDEEMFLYLTDAAFI